MKLATSCFALISIAGCSTAANNGFGGPPALSPTVQRAALGSNVGSNDLLYITNYGTSSVKVYDWPSLKPTGTLKGLTFEEGLCVDAKGNVFVPNTGADDIEEYAHAGSKPIATLADLPNYYPNSCSVDPVSGDLAVMNLGYASGNLVIFHHATGQPKPYIISTIFSYYMCGYDDRGNLVIDGLNKDEAAAFAILPRGSTRLQPLTLDRSPRSAGGVQWDGKHWAIGDGYATIYQFDISGTNGTKVGQTTLTEGSSTVFGFFIAGDRIIAPEHSGAHGTGRRTQIFRYPAGGAAIGSIRGLNLPFGAVISRGT